MQASKVRAQGAAVRSSQDLSVRKRTRVGEGAVDHQPGSFQRATTITVYSEKEIQEHIQALGRREVSQPEPEKKEQKRPSKNDRQVKRNDEMDARREAIDRALEQRDGLHRRYEAFENEIRHFIVQVEELIGFFQKKACISDFINLAVFRSILAKYREELVTINKNKEILRSYKSRLQKWKKNVRQPVSDVVSNSLFIEQDHLALNEFQKKLESDEIVVSNMGIHIIKIVASKKDQPVIGSAGEKAEENDEVENYFNADREAAIDEGEFKELLERIEVEVEYAPGVLTKYLGLQELGEFKAVIHGRLIDGLLSGQIKKESSVSLLDQLFAILRKDYVTSDRVRGGVLNEGFSVKVICRSGCEEVLQQN